MAAMKRLPRLVRPWCAIRHPKTLIHQSVTSGELPCGLHYQSFEPHIRSNATEVQYSRFTSQVHGLFNMFPALIAGLFGVGLQELTYSDAEADAKTSSSADSPSGYEDVEQIARNEKQRLEELLKSKGMRYGSYPRFTVAIKGQKVTVKFQIPSTCDVPHLIVNLVSRLGLKVEDRGGASDMILRGWDSAVAWQLSLSYPEKHTESKGSDGQLVDKKEDEGDLCILIFRSLISTDRPEVEFIKKGRFSSTELDALASALQLAGGKMGQNRNYERKPRDNNVRLPSAEKSVASLEAMGVRVFGLDEAHLGSSGGEISWDNIAGYDQQKREIEDTMLLALHSPEVYDDIARGTRRKFESNRPRAVLFEGPPGTGKTSCARVIANQAGVPLLYVPLEVVMSKYYGESERLLGTVFSLANDLDGAIIFLDEVDSFAVSRGTEMHEATRRILSVILRQIDGFEQDKKVVVIAATNRKQDLDPALISRFDSMITFSLPDQQNRQQIAAQYAKHLKEPELVELAAVTDGMSGRDIRDVCQQAERRWASKIIRGQVPKDAEEVCLPPLQIYLESAVERKNSLLSISEQKLQSPNPRPKKPQLDLA